MPSRMQHRRASQAGGVFALVGLLVTPLAFLSIPQSPRQQVTDTSRRDVLASIPLFIATSMQAPALAANAAPEKLEVTGALGKRNNVNGFWTIVPGTKINERSVYKRDGQELYLLFNDCNQFQISNKPTGECNGFAVESKAKWTMDGAPVGLKVKPIKQQAAPEPKVTPTSGDQPADGLGLGLNFQLPSFGAPKQEESDDDLLFSGENVNAYIKKKGGGGGSAFLAASMIMDPEDDKVADSLEARLKARR
jgi:hypothetical protein